MLRNAQEVNSRNIVHYMYLKNGNPLDIERPTQPSGLPNASLGKLKAWLDLAH